VITKKYQSVSRDTTYIRGKLALLYKAKERAMWLLSSTIETFRQAELREGEFEVLQLAMDDLISPSVSDDDSLSSGGSDED